MEIFSVDSIKEQIIKNNPFWMKYITISGIYNFDGDRMYITNEDGTSKIKIDDSFRERVISQGIEDGETIKLEGFLNYGGINQKSKDNKETKIQNIFFDKSYLSFVFYPKDVEFEQEISQNSKNSKENENKTNTGCFFLLIIFILTIVYLIVK